MENIKLGQLLQYYDKTDEPERLQIVTIQDWKDADEILYDSELLEPFKDYEIQHMKAELSNGRPIIRVAIMKG